MKTSAVIRVLFLPAKVSMYQIAVSERFSIFSGDFEVKQILLFVRVRVYVCVCIFGFCTVV